MGDRINIAKMYTERLDLNEPDGWYFGIPYYGLNPRCFIPAIEGDYGIRFVKYDWLRDINIFVLPKYKSRCKAINFFEGIDHWLKRKLHRCGLCPLQPMGEVFQWKYFLSLPKVESIKRGN